MSPAYTANNGPDLRELVRQITLSIVLLRWFAEHSHGVGVVAILAEARRGAPYGEIAIFDFLERYIAGGEH